MAGETQRTDATQGRRDDVVALYLEIGPELTRWARLLVGDDALAARCVRDAFVRLYLSSDISQVDDPAHEARVALFAAARSMRTKVRGSGSGSANEDLPIAVAALQQLTARQRECVVLRHYGGMTEGQTARVVGVSIGSVRTHYRRGMAHLTGWLFDAAAAV